MCRFVHLLGCSYSCHCLFDFIRPFCVFWFALSGLVDVFKWFCYVFFGFLLVFNDIPAFCDCWVVTVIGFPSALRLLSRRFLISSVPRLSFVLLLFWFPLPRLLPSFGRLSFRWPSRAVGIRFFGSAFFAFAALFLRALLSFFLDSWFLHFPSFYFFLQSLLFFLLCLWVVASPCSHIGFVWFVSYYGWSFPIVLLLLSFHLGMTLVDFSMAALKLSRRVLWSETLVPLILKLPCSSTISSVTLTRSDFLFIV